MWNKCPDCNKKSNYFPVLSWFEKKTCEQCKSCEMQERLDKQRWEDEGGNPEIEFAGGQHISIFGRRLENYRCEDD